MAHDRLGYWSKTVILLISLFFVVVAYTAEIKKDSVRTKLNTLDLPEKEVLGKVKTIYDFTGRPSNQSRANKGWHQIEGFVTLVGGRANVVLNTSTSQGRQDVSFLNDSSYSASAIVNRDSSATFTYRFVPISGSKFMIMSSSLTDTSTLYIKIEGQ